MKVFIYLAAILLLLVAACHGYRAYEHLDFIFAGHSIPIIGSWIAAGVTGFLGLMLLIAGARK